MAGPLIIEAQGLIWTVLLTAERSYAEQLGHRRVYASLDVTRERAEQEWMELLSHVHRLEARPRDKRLEVWRAGIAWENVSLIVEPTATGKRVCKVRPIHGRWALELEAPPTAPPIPPPAARETPDPRVVHRAAPSSPASALAAAAPVPDVDAGVLLLVQRELGRGGDPEVSAIARRLHLDREVVRRALRVLDGYAPPPTAPARAPWTKRVGDLAAVEVVMVRPRRASK